MARTLRPQETYTIKQLYTTFVGLTALWGGAYLGFVFVLPLIAGREISYNTDPLLSMAYYAAWAAVTLALFPRTLTRVHMAQDKTAYMRLLVFLGLVALFYALVLPALPGYGSFSSESGSFALNAMPDYFLPKTAEILFQQLLVAAGVLALASFENNVLFVSLLFALLFSLPHIFGFADLPAAFVTVYFIAALLSALSFPYLMLRVRNGFVYSFMLHWAFYIVFTLLFLS